ncbi:hypothetical protein [Lacticaseibacillus parakribbianus]|uniref:hypothetical protein n=1 Tax=Lacticaseibacillus parakribbianus TaxID=2970927 RepID=UPI0021CB40C3|nr:hypothetical protein [Lacticaseibacillus parakribbianus]
MKSKWVKLAVALAVSVVALAGCFGGKKAAETKPSTYQTALAAGVLAVKQDDFAGALDHFQAAVAAKKTKAAATDLAQTKAYLKAQSQEQAGRPVRAHKTVTQALKRKHGAKALTTKLKAYAKRLAKVAKQYRRAASLLKEAQAQADAGETTQAKETLAPLAPLDWSQDYLKRLKADYDALVQQLDAAAASTATAASSDSTSTSDQTSTSSAAKGGSAKASDPTAADQPKVSWNQAAKAQGSDADAGAASDSSSSKDTATATAPAGNDLSAADVRSAVLTYFGTQLSAAAVNAVPDSGILQAYKDTLAVGGDVGYTVSLLEERYPDVVANGKAATTTGDDSTTGGN